MGSVDPQVSADAKVTAADAQETTDGFHLIIDALKLNGLNTIYGVPGIPITAEVPQALAPNTLGRALNSTNNVYQILPSPNAGSTALASAMYDDRINEIDTRFARTFKAGKAKVQAIVEVYNILNGRADQIKEFLHRLDTFSDELNQQRDDITRAIRSSDTLLKVVADRNDTAAVFDRIVRDNSSYYVLAYYPPKIGRAHV